MKIAFISFWGLGALLVLLVPIFLLNSRLGISQNKRIVYVVTRMFLQLSLMGIFLQYLFVVDNPFFNASYLLLMMFTASFSTLKSTGLSFKKVGLPLFIAFGVPSALLVLYFNHFCIGLDLPLLFSARYFIPIGGMLMGNSLSGVIIGLNHFYESLRENKNTYLYTLGLGASRNEALLPYLKTALTAAVNPTMASTETIGLVHLPGMMTGQILGGSYPVIAIRYQIAIMLGILIIRYASTYTAISLTALRGFDGFDILDM